MRRSRLSRRSGRPPQIAVVCVAVVLLLTVGAPPAGAHAKLLGASPRPGATVGGSFTRYDVALDQAAVRLHRMELQTEDAEPLGGSWEQVAPNLLRFTAEEPLTEPGNYIVSYRVTVQDGDTTRSAFVFRYEPDAAPPAPVRPDDILPERSLVVPLGLAVLLVVGAAIVVTSLVRSRPRRTPAA